jgi:hypothetical protein
MTHRTLGITIHTGWAACVVVGGSLRRPDIIANEIIEILGDSERFCYHRAAGMPLESARSWIRRMHAKALANARNALTPLLAPQVTSCAIVARAGTMGSLQEVLASHARIHSAEGCFYRDVVREACTAPAHIVAPASLDTRAVGKLAGPPWSRDQKLAALAAWSIAGN